MPNGLKRRLPYANGTLWQIGRILWKHLADFLKTTRTKFAVICVKKRQKARFLRYHPPSGTLPALIGASTFAFNKYPHKPYIF